MGFGNTFQGILAGAENYLDEPLEEFSENANKWLKRIEDFYETIPFDDLHGKEEYYPLFVVKRLLPKIRENLDEVFDEKKKGSLRNLVVKTGSVVEIGRLYSDSFLGLLRDIRSNPEEKDFYVGLKDYSGQDWEF